MIYKQQPLANVEIFDFLSTPTVILKFNWLVVDSHDWSAPPLDTSGCISSLPQEYFAVSVVIYGFAGKPIASYTNFGHQLVGGCL